MNYLRGDMRWQEVCGNDDDEGVNEKIAAGQNATRWFLEVKDSNNMALIATEELRDRQTFNLRPVILPDY